MTTICISQQTFPRREAGFGIWLKHHLDGSQGGHLHYSPLLRLSLTPLLGQAVQAGRLLTHAVDVQGELSLNLMISQRSPENQN